MEAHKKHNLSKHTSIGKPLFKQKLIWAGVARNDKGEPLRQPEHFLRVKILCNSIEVFTKASGSVWFDHWIVLSDQEKMVCTISLRRFYKTLDVNLMEIEVLPRILHAVQDEFIKEYPDGIILHVMGIHPLPSYAIETSYKDFK